MSSGGNWLPQRIDFRAAGFDAAAEILFASMGLALAGNAALALLLGFGSRSLEGDAGNLLVASLLALMPLQSLHDRGISRAQAYVLVLLSAAMAVVVRLFIYT